MSQRGGDDGVDHTTPPGDGSFRFDGENSAGSFARPCLSPDPSSYPSSSGATISTLPPYQNRTQDEEDEETEDTVRDTIQRVHDIEMLLNYASIGDVKTSLAFIEALRDASHECTGMDPSVLHRLRNPFTKRLELSDPDLRLSLDVYIGLEQSSQDTYRTMKSAVERRYSTGMLSFEACRQKTVELSGVSTLAHDMCPKTCIAYTGPFEDKDICTDEKCAQPRYGPTTDARGKQVQVARRKFMTIPLGPQIQAAYRHPESAYNMGYRERATAAILTSEDEHEDYEDYIHGSDYLDLVRNGVIGPKDIVLMFSIDGAQLYQNKASDVWIYIWVILNLPPDLRYKKAHVIPGGFIPGPEHPGSIS